MPAAATAFRVPTRRCRPRHRASKGTGHMSDTRRGGVRANDAPVPAGFGLPFVGRARELDALRARLDAAEAGAGGVAMLVGEAGIGKTRALQEFAAEARGRGASVLWGRCFEGDWSPPFAPWADALGRYAGTTD